MNEKNLNQAEARPFPNEHSCRLKDPGKYKKFARKNCHQKHDGKCIDYIFGILEDKKSELQAMRYKTKVWTKEAARAHCKDHDGTFEAAKEEDKGLDEPERRYLPFGQEMRAVEEDGKMIIEGYAMVYNVYAPIWWFREIIRPGAATEALKTADEFVLWDHESSQPMARRSNDSLEVKEDDHGVHIRADVSKTFWGRNGYESVKNKVTDKMSFCFDLYREGEKWHTDEVEGVKIETREIIEFAHLYDYSPVSYPAYKQTSLDARGRVIALSHRPDLEASSEGGAAAPQEVIAEWRALIEQRGILLRQEEKE